MSQSSPLLEKAISMIHILCGSAEDFSVHVFVFSASNADLPWRGPLVIEAGARPMILRADSDLLGRGELSLSTVSLLSRGQVPRDLDAAPTAPYAIPERQGDGLVFDVQQPAAGPVHVAIRLPGDLFAANASLPQDLGQVRVLVDTFMMGRADFMARADVLSSG